jgi:Zn-dependent peptidase ImmA (M78 family)
MSKSDVGVGVRFTREMQQKAAAEIAAHYGVSKQLTDWRLRRIGVDMQMRRSLKNGVRVGFR